MIRQSSSDPRFLRLFGDLKFAQDAADVELPLRPPVEWKPLPKVEDHPEYDEDVRRPEDWLQPPALGIQILFEPQPQGVYDVQWIVPDGTELAAGDAVARCYRTSDGLRFQQTTPLRLKVEEVLVPRNRRVIPGDPLMRATVPGAALDFQVVQSMISEQIAEIAQAANAVVKGFMGSLGESGQVTESVLGVPVELHCDRGYAALIDQIVSALNGMSLENGDIVVVSEKVIAQAQGRVFPADLLLANDPKTVDRVGRDDALSQVAQHVPDVTSTDLLLADMPQGDNHDAMATAGVRDANTVAYELSQALSERAGVCCDVVISDTDTGLDVREQIIGCWTLGATPLGATAGLVIYECMRVANAAEFVRGAHRRIPIVLCKPHMRRRRRNGTGEHRGYSGFLDARRERLIGFA